MPACPHARELNSTARRAGAAVKGIVPVAPVMAATVKFFGRYKGGAIRDGVLLAVDDAASVPAASA